MRNNGEESRMNEHLGKSLILYNLNSLGSSKKYPITAVMNLDRVLLYSLSLMYQIHINESEMCGSVSTFKIK